MSKNQYKDIIAFHPGYYVKELMEEMEMTQSEFAKRLNTTDKTISKLLNGDIPLSKELAKNLSQMLGTSINVWLDLQKKYDEKCCSIEQMKAIDEEFGILCSLDYKYFEALGAVPVCKSKKDQVEQLRKYLRVSSLKVLSKQDLLVACKTSILNIELKNVINANAWIQTGINFAKKLECNSFNKQKFLGYLDEIRQMTVEKPEVFYPRLKEIFSECGIAFVALPYLKNSGINGAVKWINQDKVLLLINDRNKHADVFWFSLFHEIKHILQQKMKTVYVSFEKRKSLTLGSSIEENELEADEFARNKLIPKKAYQKFIDNNCIDKCSIIKFANEIGVHPCIVLGRLKFEKVLDWCLYNDLRIQYEII